MTTNEKRNPPMSVGFDIVQELIKRDGSQVAIETRFWLANRITEAVNAARDEVAQIRSMLLEAQGDDDGGRILPEFEEGASTHAMVAACVHLLERRRDVIDAYEEKVDASPPSP